MPHLRLGFCGAPEWKHSCADLTHATYLFIYFYLEAIFGDARGLLLALHSYISPGGPQENLWGSQGSNLGCLNAKQVSYLPCYLSSPKISIFKVLREQIGKSSLEEEGSEISGRLVPVVAHLPTGCLG